MRVMLAGPIKGEESSGRKWGTGHRVVRRKGKGLWGVECTLAVIGTAGGPINIK